MRNLLKPQSDVALAGRRLPLPLVVLAALSMVGSAPPGSAGGEGALAECRSVEVRSLTVATVRAETSGGIKPEAIEESSLSGGEMTTQVTVFGPPLGSMDSPSIQTEVGCWPSGVVLTATITRSAAFNGAVLQNALWQPRIRLLMRLRQRHVPFRTVWRMRSTEGVELTFAQTPPFQGRRFPIVQARRLG